LVKALIYCGGLLEKEEWERGLKEKLVLYFYEKDKSISLEQLFAKHPLEESGR
ncbi:917_t:CDS:2, partial [Cetraspora pellucida]